MSTPLKTIRSTSLPATSPKTITKRMKSRAQTPAPLKLPTQSHILSILDTPVNNESGTPALLLPIRLETRFLAATAGKVDLVIRVYPDQWPFKVQETTVENKETTAVTAFFEVCQRNKKEEIVLAWETLCDQLGEARALILSGLLAPPQTGRGVKQVRPSVVGSARSGAFLPSRWIAIGTRGDEESFVAQGANIPADLPVFSENDGQEPTWLYDLAEAERVGMALRVSLTEAEAARGVDVLHVFGLCDMSGQSGRERLEWACQGWFQGRGLRTLSRSTPTNGAPLHRSREDAMAMVMTRRQNPSPASGTRGALLQRALGELGAGSCLTLLEGADQHDDALSALTIQALLQVTAKVTFEDVLGKNATLSEQRALAATAATLDIWAPKALRPGGPLPLLQIGAQPLGILPITTPWDGSEPVPGLFKALRALTTLWEDGATDLDPIDLQDAEAVDSFLRTSPTLTLAGATTDAQATAGLNILVQLLTKSVQPPVPPGGDAMRYLAAAGRRAVRSGSTDTAKLIETLTDLLGLLELDPSPGATLDRLVAETLALATDRLDAWFTALATDRLWRLREANRSGLLLGAYGYVEDLRRNEVREAPEHILAPSLDAATTAGILRAGYRTSKDLDDGSSPFDLDLSGARLRGALSTCRALATGESPSNTPEAIDALRDLALAEATHALLQGDLAHTGVILQALESGDRPLPTPRLLENTAQGVVVRHQVILALEAAPKKELGWKRSGLAELEPRLEALAQEVLGDAKLLTYTSMTGTVHDLSRLCALDVVVAARRGEHDMLFEGGTPSPALSSALVSVRYLAATLDRARASTEMLLSTNEPTVDLNELVTRMNRWIKQTGVAVTEDWNKSRSGILRTLEAISALAGVPVLPLVSALERPQVFPGGHGERWLHTLAPAREALSALEDLRIVTPSLRAPPLVHQEQEADVWVGLERPASNKDVSIWRSRVAFDPHGGLAAGRPVALLEVDQFEELLPDPRTSMGIALRWDAPSACAPQTLLLGVLQSGQSWTPRSLLALLDESRRLFHIRMVDARCIAFGQVPLPAVYLDV